jgi:hypothetical protein
LGFVADGREACVSQVGQICRGQADIESTLAAGDVNFDVILGGTVDDDLEAFVDERQR